MRSIISVILFIVVFVTVGKSQIKITFPSSDSLTITADYYDNKSDMPYVLLFHQAGYSRGEYKEIAPKIARLGYNCLAVDLRSGNEANYVKNETAALAKSKGKSQEYIDAEKDILAAIDYAYNKSKKPVVIFGSSYSATLCLKIANKNEKVKAVIAYSPGDFLKPHFELRDAVKGLKKPVFIATSQREFPYIADLEKIISSETKVFFKPQNGQGEHGAKTLWSTCTQSKEYWLTMMLFFKKI
jgi:dienelactone hydrolase